MTAISELWLTLTIIYLLLRIFGRILVVLRLLSIIITILTLAKRYFVTVSIDSLSFFKTAFSSAVLVTTSNALSSALTIIYLLLASLVNFMTTSSSLSLVSPSVTLASIRFDIAIVFLLVISIV